MKFYLVFVYRMITRFLSESRVHQLLIGITILFFFVFLSLYVLHKNLYMQYMYALIPIVLSFTLNGSERNLFLQCTFSWKEYLVIRFIENFSIALPFIVLLLIKGNFLTALALLALVNINMVLKKPNHFFLSLPNPFTRYPFEFTIGYRRSIFLLVLSYLLSGIGIFVHNFNLAIFFYWVILIHGAFFYAEAEDIFYVWNVSLRTNHFLLSKIRIAFLYTTILALPLILSLMILFYDRYIFILAVMLLGYANVLNSILFKYGSYPKGMTLIRLLIFSSSILLPPLLLFTIPYYLLASRRQLKTILK